MSTAPKCRIDVAIHDMLMHSPPQAVRRPMARGRKIPEPVFPQFPEKLSDPSPETLPKERNWSLPLAPD
jgi:hypothetical protein